MARHPTCWRGGVSQGRGSSSRRPCGGGDHGPGDAVPRVALARHADDRLARAGAQVGRRLEPRREVLGQLRDRVRSDLERQPRAGPRADRGGQRARRPRPCRSGRRPPGSAPHDAASAATMPNASGNVLGIASASAAGSTSVSSSCSSRPAQWIRAAIPLGRGAVRRGLGAERVEERGQLGQLAPVLAAQRPGRVEVAARQRGGEPFERLAERAEADDEQARVRHAAEHERPGGEQQLDALGRDQLADVDDDPVAAGVERAERGGGLGRGASERRRDVRAAPPAPSVLRARLAGARGRPPRRARRAARTGRRRRRAARGGSAPPGRARRAPPTGSPPVWREPTSTPPAPARPFARGGQEARVRLDRVLQRAAVDLHGVRHAGAGERPARGSAGPSRGGWRARRRAARAPRPRAPRPRCARRTRRPRPRSASGTAAPRRRRSGPPRRPAAGRRCPAGRRSRAAGRGARSDRARRGPSRRRRRPTAAPAASRSWHSRWTSWPPCANASPSAAL